MNKVDRYNSLCAVHLIILKKNEMLLYRRANTDWNNGKYNFPGGHLEENESILEACIREAKEETDIDINKENLELVHVLHRRYNPKKSIETNKDYIDLFFKVINWNGEPKITEEDKSDDMLWVDINNPHENQFEFEKHVLEQVKRNSLYSDFSG